MYAAVGAKLMSKSKREKHLRRSTVGCCASQKAYAADAGCSPQNIRGKNSVTSVVIIGQWGTKNIDIYTFFLAPKAFNQTLAKYRRFTFIINNSNDSKHLNVDFFGFIFWNVGVVTHFPQILFYKQTMSLRTATFTQRTFYAYMLLHGELCAQTHFYTQEPLHTKVFTQKNFYTQKLYTPMFYANMFLLLARHLRTDALHTDAFTHRHFHKQKLLHRNLCAKQKLHEDVFISPPPNSLFFLFPFVSLPDNEPLWIVF